jgi:hypothetical protein
MLTRCHACGATASLDVLVTNEDAKSALNAVFALSGPLGKSMIRYLALFRPAQRVLTHARMATLLGELQPFMAAGHIPRKGRDWPVQPADWVQAIELTLQARDTGKLTLPLSSHGYLFEVLCSLADRAERVQEEAVEATRLGRGYRAAAAAPASLATVTVRGQTMTIGQGLAQVYGGRDPELAKLDADSLNKKGMPAEFRQNLAALRAGTLNPKSA